MQEKEEAKGKKQKQNKKRVRERFDSENDKYVYCVNKSQSATKK